MRQPDGSSAPPFDYQNKAISTREIWGRYAATMIFNTALIAGFLYFIQEPESRFRLGGFALAILSILTGYIFDYKLPKDNRNPLIITVLDIITFALAAIIFWIIVREANMPQERIYAVVGNHWPWLCVWGIFATSRLKMALQSVSLVQAGKASARIYA